MQKLSQITNKISDSRDGVSLESALRGVYNRLSTQTLTSGALAQAGTTTKMKTAAIVHYFVNGAGRSKAITDNLWDPLAGFVVNIGKSNVLCLYLAADGTASSAFGTEVTTVDGIGLSGLRFPPHPESKVMVGFVILTGGVTAWTAGTSTFTTSTTDYYCTIVNTIGALDPTATI